MELSSLARIWARSCAIICGDREGGVLQVDAHHFFAALQDLLEDFDEIDERHDEIGFGAFVVVERFVGPGPDVFFDLLLLVEQLGGVLEFFVFDQALHKFGAWVGGQFFRCPRAGRAGAAFST